VDTGCVDSVQRRQPPARIPQVLPLGKRFSPVTSTDVKLEQVGATNERGGALFALSGTAGAVPPAD